MIYFVSGFGGNVSPCIIFSWVDFSSSLVGEISDLVSWGLNSDTNIALMPGGHQSCL